MSSSETPILDPDVYKRNMEALSQRQPAVAGQIRSATASGDVVPVMGRDGSLTFRIPGPEGRPIWLGRSSMPTVSSPALVREFNTGTTNVLLPSMGHGGEVRHLLNRLQPHQAVFTWDSEPLVPVLALRLQDFSRDILAGRLILAIDPSPDKALLACFEDCPTHLPPAKIFAAPHLRPGEVHQLQTGVETAISRQQHRQTELVSQTERQLKEHQPSSGGPVCGLAVLSMVVDPQLSDIASALKQAADEMNIHCLVHIADRPGRVHLLSFARFLLDHRPDRVILLNQVKGELGSLLEAVPH